MGENRFWEGSCASAVEQKNPEKTNAIGTSVGPNMCLRFMIFIIRDRPIPNSRGAQEIHFPCYHSTNESSWSPRTYRPEEALS